MKPKELIDTAKKHLADLTGFSKPAGIGLKKEKGNNFPIPPGLLQKGSAKRPDV